MIGKSLLRKAFVFFLLFGGAGALGYYYVYSSVEMIPVDVVFAGFGILVLLFLIYYFFSFVHPFKQVLHEMESLLTGRPYKKVFTKRTDEIGILAYFFNQMISSLSKISGKLREGERMTYELNVASEVQRSILPPQSPKIDGLYIIAKSRPAAEVGGDNFDFIHIGNRTIAYIGDVTGHGVPAGLIMMMVNTLVHAFSERYTSIYDIVVHVNSQLKSRLKEALFMTMVMLSYDHEKKVMSFVGCGHEHILVYHVAEGKVESFMSGGIALGMVPDNSKIVKEVPLDMKPGDFVLLYTDGITEARNMKEEMYGLPRLIGNVERFAVEYPPEGVVQHIAEELSHFVEGHTQDDDMTLIVLQPVSGAVDSSDFSTSWNSAA